MDDVRRTAAGRHDRIAHDRHARVSSLPEASLESTSLSSAVDRAQSAARIGRVATLAGAPDDGEIRDLREELPEVVGAARAQPVRRQGPPNGITLPQGLISDGVSGLSRLGDRSLIQR
jgi:hypothetical protein